MNVFETSFACFPWTSNKIEPVDDHRYYVYAIDERNGEYEYTHKSTVRLDPDQDPHEWLEEYTSDFYGDGEKEDDYYWFNGEIICWASSIREVTIDEYRVLCRHM